MPSRTHWTGSRPALGAMRTSFSVSMALSIAMCASCSFGAVVEEAAVRAASGAAAEGNWVAVAAGSELLACSCSLVLFPPSLLSPSPCFFSW